MGKATVVWLCQKMRGQSCQNELLGPLPSAAPAAITKMPAPGWLANSRSLVSQLWRSEAPNQGASVRGSSGGSLPRCTPPMSLYPHGRAASGSQLSGDPSKARIPLMRALPASPQLILMTCHGPLPIPSHGGVGFHTRSLEGHELSTTDLLCPLGGGGACIYSLINT